MTTRRRLLLAVGSVTAGTLLSALLFKRRVGTLGVSEYTSLLFNLFFALAIVIAIGIVLNKMNKK